VLFWGRNALETHVHVVPVLKAVRDRGGETAVLEIRSTPTTRSADRWWRLDPGGDWALAAWICRRLLDEGTAVQGWRARTANPAEFAAAVNSLDWGALLSAAGMTRDGAEDVYSWLLRYSPVTQYPAFGAQRYLHGTRSSGGSGPWRFSSAPSRTRSAGLAFSKDEMALFPERLLPAPEKTRALSVSGWPLELDGLEPPVEVLVVSAADPLRQNPATDLVRRAYEKIPFTVCADFVLSDTAKASDLVLPITTFLEEEGDWKGSYWHSYLVRSERVLPPRPGTLDETEIYTRLADKLGLSCDLVAMKKEMDRELLASPLLESVGGGVYRWNEPPCRLDGGDGRPCCPRRFPEWPGGRKGISGW
jgi:anaerobic selenocysteine-containing dehydrogenase